MKFEKKNLFWIREAALHEHVIVAVVLYDFGDFAQCLHGA